ncbi:MAG: hypothetical protein AB7O59_22015 [Pirellulales bacterium]
MRLILRIFGQPPAGPRRAMLLRRLTAVCGLLLMAATWRLWTPQDVFPQVPLLAIGAAVPPVWQWLGAAGMVAGLALAALAPQTGPWAPRGLLLFAASAAAMIVLDTQRLQPWAYQTMIVALVLALAESRAAIALLRLFVVSFYIHSAISKFDYTFLHTLGQQFLAVLAASCGLVLKDWSDGTRLAAAAVFPAVELAVPLGLCFPRTRRVALAGAILLHVVLLWILGPWGLDQKLGVLLWNVSFMAQDILLFSSVRWLGSPLAPAPAETSAVDGPAPRAPRALQGLVWAVVCLPLLQPSTWYDSWPSWALYAPHCERVALFVHRRALDDLNPALKPYLEQPADALDPWLALRLDRWCLEALAAPIYPQCRTQLGVAEAAVTRDVLASRVRIVRFELADRLTGARQHDVLTGLPQFQSAAGEYFFNARARSWLVPRAPPAESAAHENP